jgi:hypothetical protein
MLKCVIKCLSACAEDPRGILNIPKLRYCSRCYQMHFAKGSHRYENVTQYSGYCRPTVLMLLPSDGSHVTAVRRFLCYCSHVTAVRRFSCYCSHVTVFRRFSCYCRPTVLMLLPSDGSYVTVLMLLFSCYCRQTILMLLPSDGSHVTVVQRFSFYCSHVTAVRRFSCFFMQHFSLMS